MLKKRLLLGLGLLAGALQAQQVQWTVRPEWVRAHEEFLASDAMAGRGSATRDEELAATYVASEMMGYGLKPAPGLASYLQSAEVVIPVLDGHATLRFGATELQEGEDFVLLNSSGGDTEGALVRVSVDEVAKATMAKHAAVLITGVPAKGGVLQLVSPLARAGAGMVLVADDAGIERVYAARGGKTRVGARLKDQAPEGVTLVALKPAALAKVAAALGEARLTVQVLPEETPRKTFNAIGYLPGSEPASGTILLTAHLDHLGIGHPVFSDAIYNGANDDASGTTAVLELAHALAAGPRLKRNVLFVCYGSEEIGELGSTYFGEHSPVPLASLVANVEFEMIGTQDPKTASGVLTFTGWERSNLGPALKEHGAKIGPDPAPEQHFFERSDNYALALQGVVAHTAAGWGTPPTYHQPSDDLVHLNLEFMTSVIQSLVEPVRWLAMSDFRPAWNAGGRPAKQ